MSDERQQNGTRWLRQRFPALFGTQYRPFAIGVMQELLAYPGRPDVSGVTLRKLVAMRARHYRYLAAVASPDAMRYGLDGKAVEPVKKAQKKAARDVLAARKEARRARSFEAYACVIEIRPVPALPAVSRIIDDVRRIHRRFADAEQVATAVALSRGLSNIKPEPIGAGLSRGCSEGVIDRRSCFPVGVGEVAVIDLTGVALALHVAHRLGGFGWSGEPKRRPKLSHRQRHADSDGDDCLHSSTPSVAMKLQPSRLMSVTCPHSSQRPCVKNLFFVGMVCFAPH